MSGSMHAFIWNFLCSLYAHACVNLISVSDYVLNDFNEDEINEISKITKNISNSLSILVDKKLELFSSTVNNIK